MKILHIANISNRLTAGVPVAVRQYVINQEKICDVTLLNIAHEKIEGIKNQVIYSNVNNLLILLKEIKVDLIIFNGLYFRKYIKISKELRKKEIPYIIIPHGSLTKSAQRKSFFKKKIANFLFFNKFISNAAAIQFLSNNEYNTSICKNMKFISPNGVSKKDNIKTHFNQDSFSFVYIGRMEIFIKGLDSLIKGISLIADKLRSFNCKFSFFGPSVSDSHKILNKMIMDYCISDLVIINDSIVGEEKEQILLSSDVFIQTSRSEGMPMGILEALSYGLPCLVSVGTGLGQDILEYGAGIVVNTDEFSIAKGLLEIIERKKSLEIFSKNAVKLTNDKFCWDNVIIHAIEKYKAIINSK